MWGVLASTVRCGWVGSAGDEVKRGLGSAELVPENEHVTDMCFSGQGLSHLKGEERVYKVKQQFLHQISALHLLDHINGALYSLSADPSGRRCQQEGDRSVGSGRGHHRPRRYVLCSEH